MSVHLEISSPVAIVTLDRPERHNSLVPEFLEALLDAFAQIRANENVRAVVLRANGRSFSTGGDLNGFIDHLETLELYAYEIVGLLNEVILAMMKLPAPIVAAVHGMVTGGSLGLVLGADIVLVSPNASFTPYYSLVGFSPDGGWTVLLPELIGVRRTTEILMTNQTITPERAVAWGLANRIVRQENIRDAAFQFAMRIAGQPGSILKYKYLLHPSHAEIAERLEDERTRFVRQILTPETRRSMQAFLESLNK